VTGPTRATTNFTNRLLGEIAAEEGGLNPEDADNGPIE
jgi:hypothetical protein